VGGALGAILGIGPGGGYRSLAGSGLSLTWREVVGGGHKTIMLATNTGVESTPLTGV
jgi:hypothetical protein